MWDGVDQMDYGRRRCTLAAPPPARKVEEEEEGKKEARRRKMIQGRMLWRHGLSYFVIKPWRTLRPGAAAAAAAAAALEAVVEG